MQPTGGQFYHRPFVCYHVSEANESHVRSWCHRRPQSHKKQREVINMSGDIYNFVILIAARKKIKYKKHRWYFLRFFFWVHIYRLKHRMYVLTKLSTQTKPTTLRSKPQQSTKRREQATMLLTWVTRLWWAAAFVFMSLHKFVLNCSLNIKLAFYDTLHVYL